MNTQEYRKEYVSHADVMDMVRYLEAGYGGRIMFRMTVACPKGEQYCKEYWEVVFCDGLMVERALPHRILASFPCKGSKSIAGLWLGMLYNLDAAMASGYIWTEPTIQKKPQVVGA